MEQRTGVDPTPGPGLPGPLARRRSAGRSPRLRRATLVALVLAVAFSATAWPVSTKLAARERDRADSRLLSSLGAAQGELGAIVADAAADARGLARAAAVRRAVTEGDTAAVARLARTFPGLVVSARGRPLTPRPPPSAHVTTAVVLTSGGARAGRIGIATPLDGALLRRLHERAGTALLFARSGRVIAGVRVASGGPIDLQGQEPRTLVVGNRSFRAVGGPVPGTDVRLVSLVPAAVVREAEDRQLRIVALVAVLCFLLLVALVDGVLAVARRPRA